MGVQTVIISVTRKDIAEGRRASPSFCPVALAIRRRYPKKAISVAEKVIFISSIGERMSPESVCQFVESFDHRKPVKPFRFKLEVK